jgi:hypothetical protein
MILPPGIITTLKSSPACEKLDDMATVPTDIEATDMVWSIVIDGKAE